MNGTDQRWWENPDRPCKDREDYADLTLVEPGPGKRKRIRAMQDACLHSCPVLRQCREDLLTYSPDWNHYGIQAGIKGRV